MKICLYGAGSIGGIIGAHLARVKGIEVSLIARGAHLDAIRRNGLRLVSPHEDFTVKVNATDDPAQLGPQDVVFITLKTHQYLSVLDKVMPLLGPQTALIPLILLTFALPRALYGPPLSLRSFSVLARNRKILLLLSITILSLSAQLIVFVYLAPLLQTLSGASHEVIGLMFALFGVAGFIGNVVATRLVGELGTWATAGVFIGCTFVGLLSWSLGAGYLPAMGAGLGFIGLGFAATNSMQQARLVQAAPELSSASVALTTSGVYVGQAIGSGVGGILFGLGWLHGIGFVGLAFAAAGLGVWSVTRDR